MTKYKRPTYKKPTVYLTDDKKAQITRSLEFIELLGKEEVEFEEIGHKARQLLDSNFLNKPDVLSYIKKHENLADLFKSIMTVLNDEVKSDRHFHRHDVRFRTASRILNQFAEHADLIGASFDCRQC